MNTVGAFPAKYWSQGDCKHWEKLSGETYHEEHEIKPHACAKCFMACGRMAKIKKGRHKDLVIHVKGMEPAGYDPRVLKGMGLTLATSPRGACHLRTTFYKPELSGMIPPEQIEEKAEMFIEYEDRLNIFDTLVLCRFYRDLYSWEELEKVLQLVTGLDNSTEWLREIAASQ